MNLNGTFPILTTLDPSPIFSVSTAVVVLVDHRLIVVAGHRFGNWTGIPTRSERQWGSEVEFFLIMSTGNTGYAIILNVYMLDTEALDDCTTGLKHPVICIPK